MAGVAVFTVGFAVGAIGSPAAVPVAATLAMAGCFAAACFPFAACIAAACFAIAACFAMAACLAASVMTDLIVERIKHDLSWRRRRILCVARLGMGARRTYRQKTGRGDRGAGQKEGTVRGHGLLHCNPEAGSSDHTLLNYLTFVM